MSHIFEPQREIVSEPYMTHCVKSVRIRSYSCPYFLSFGLNTDRHFSRSDSFNTSTLQHCALFKTIIAFLVGKNSCQYFKRGFIVYFIYFICQCLQATMMHNYRFIFFLRVLKYLMRSRCILNYKPRHNIWHFLIISLWSPQVKR